MDHSKKLGIMFAVALLVLSLTVPAAAKRGGEPGPPTGSDLDVTVTTGSFAWANSGGDIIRFEIIVTNKGSEEMIVDSVAFDGEVVTAPNATLAKNASWTMDYSYSVPEADLEGLPVQESTDVSKTVAVTATVGTTTLEESAAASFTAHPIEPPGRSVRRNDEGGKR